MTAYAPVYRLVIYAPRSIDPSEAIGIQPVAGAPHADYFKVTTGPAAAGPTKITAAMLSHSGMTVFTAANCVDDNLGNDGWGTDAAVSGAWLKVDLGSGVTRRFRTCRVYVRTGTYAGVYDVEYSDDAAAWTKVVTGYRPTTGDSWQTCTWQDAGVHRYWRLLLTNTPGAGPELAELELWEVEGPGAWKPYLKPVESGQRARVSAREKTSTTGVATFNLLDPALADDALTRFLPAFLGDLQGQIRAGGLKARAFESLDGGATFTSFWTGRLRTLEQISPIEYALSARELTDDLQALAFVGRPHASVTQAGFATLCPIGMAVAYGTNPAVKPLTGTMGGVSSTLGRGSVFLDNASVARPDNLLTANLIEAVASNIPPIYHYGEGFNQNLVFTGTVRARIKRLDTMATGTFKVTWSKLIYQDRHAKVKNVVLQELPAGSVGYLAIPPDTTNVEITMEAEHYATDETPLLIDGYSGPTLWRLLLEGKFGYLWNHPEQKPAGVNYGDPRLPIPYHAAKFAALEADTRFPPLRFVNTKRVPRGRCIEENILRASNLAFYFDGDGVLNPVDLRTPTDVAGVPTITDADLELGAPKRWKYNRADAITRVDGAHYTDVFGKVEDINADVTYFPRVQGAMLEELRHPVTILDLGSSDLGDEPFALDLKGFRSLPDESLNGQPRHTYLQRSLVDLAIDTARPFGVGAPTLPLSCKRGSNGDAFPGELRQISIRSVPDPATNKLGGTRVVRVTERQERKGFIDLTVMDLGLPTVAATPTLAQPAQEAGNTLNGATSAVTLNAAGDPIAVQYAVTATSEGSAPAAGSALWTPIPEGVVRTTSTVIIRGLPAGKRIWVRGRSLPDARNNYKLPSAWVAAAGTGRVDTASLAAPSAPVGSLQTGRSFRVTWTNGAADLLTELLIATPVGDARIVVARVPPGSTQYNFPGDTGLLIQPSTTYRVGVRHAQGSDEFSAEVTVDVTTTAGEPTFPPTMPRPFIFGHYK